MCFPRVHLDQNRNLVNGAQLDVPIPMSKGLWIQEGSQVKVTSRPNPSAAPIR